MGLLEEMARRLGLLYLSDLRLLPIRRTQADQLMALEQSSFSLDEFNRAAAYILGRPCRFDTKREALEAMRDAMLHV